MSLFPTKIEFGPLAAPVERNAVGALVKVVKLNKFIVSHFPSSVNIEKSKGNLVFRIGFSKEVIKSCPVLQVNETILSTVSNVEEDGVLPSLDLVVVLVGRCNGIDKVLSGHELFAGWRYMRGMFVESALGLSSQERNLLAAKQ
ncbi:hypothetical protein RUND412_005985 [Rhizina undulata]